MSLEVPWKQFLGSLFAGDLRWPIGLARNRQMLGIFLDQVFRNNSFCHGLLWYMLEGKPKPALSGSRGCFLPVCQQLVTDFDVPSLLAGASSELLIEALLLWFVTYVVAGGMISTSW